jgi:hypothetical protein
MSPIPCGCSLCCHRDAGQSTLSIPHPCIHRIGRARSVCRRSRLDASLTTKLLIRLKSELLLQPDRHGPSTSLRRTLCEFTLQYIRLLRRTLLVLESSGLGPERYSTTGGLAEVHPHHRLDINGTTDLSSSTSTDSLASSFKTS